ncbi:helix-turn-helix domain-containing protein [Corynebacterium cystitidis]|uniref:helix-turn-helix domain-containing protein n=1 Tax=Corynebacterium cystitidis TaxID=35757 RepID=UPI00211F2900|nr:helix-turn-helix transcriptional regulator [Corynebacterium cystitidis]
MAIRIRTKVLDKIRDEQELTSDEKLAHHLGLSLGTIQGLRKGRTPTLPTLVRIMDAANISSIKSVTYDTNDVNHSAA